MKTYLSLFAGIFLFLQAFPQIRETGLQERLDSIISAYDIPGATLAVNFQDGKMISIAAGFADKEAGVKMPVGGQMLLGSTGKTFVSVLFLQVLHQMRISLDSRLADFFPEETWIKSLPEGEKITLRMLLNHTSGMPRYIFQKEFLAEIKENPFQTFTPEERISYVLGKQPLHPAGEGWGYSDTNYILVGMLLEKLTGRSVYELMQAKILFPFNLGHTYPSTSPELPGLVNGYIGESNFFGLPPKTVSQGKYVMNPQFEWTGGGLVSNVEDLARWVRVIHSGTIIPYDMYREMMIPMDFKSGNAAETGYGFATFVWKNDETVSYGHTGMMPGYLTAMVYFPDGDYSIALQINSDNRTPVSLHEMVMGFASIFSAED